MSAAVALSTMRTSVRRRANIENQTGFITDAEIDEYLNAGLKEVYNFLVSARAQEYYRAQFTITTVTNASTYALPADFFELISVDVSLGGDTFLCARPYMEPERNRFKFNPGWYYNQPIYYRLVGSGNINFVPTPAGASSVILNYYPAFVPLVQNSDTFDGVNGFEEYAIWKAVAACQAKGEDDSSFALGQAGEIRAHIEALAGMRDAGAPERVHDIYAENDAWGGDY